jgi:HK97 family phage portal protein
MAWWNPWKKKSSQSRTIGTIGSWGNSAPMERNYQNFSKEAYQKNVIAFKCIQSVARAASQITFNTYDMKDKELENHPVNDLFRKPNPLQGQAAFFECLISYYMISGNSYIEAVGPKKGIPVNPMELWCMRPDRVEVVVGNYGMPKGYLYKENGNEYFFSVDEISGKSTVMHFKTFNPTSYWYGMSPIEAAVYSIDQHSETTKWNANLLKNAAMPSGMIKVPVSEMNPSGSLTEEQFQRLKQEIDLQYSGSKNAGRPLLFENGIEWQQMSLSPKDMDWIEGKNTSARDIALAFGVPPIMLNIPGDSTYSNYKEARMSFYEETVIPIMEILQDDLNYWLMPQFGIEAQLKIDYDGIQALADKRNAVFDMAVKGAWMTVNEKRVMTGFEPLDGWDVVLVGQTPMVKPDEPVEEELEEELEETPEEEAPQDEEDNQTDDEVAHLVDSIMIESKGLRIINNINSNEKRKLQRQQDAIRKRIEVAFEMDLKDDLDKQAEDIANAIETSSPQLFEFAMLKAIDESTKDIEKTIEKYIRRTAKIFGENLFNDAKSQGIVMETKSPKTKYDQAMDKYIRTRSAEAIKTINGTSIKKAREVIKRNLRDHFEDGTQTNAQLAANIRGDLHGLSRGRANVIARTETGSAATESLLESVKSLDVPNMMKEWVATIDERTRDSHADNDGERVGINEKFSVGDYTTDRPQGEGLPADESINCRCTMTFSREV